MILPPARRIPRQRLLSNPSPPRPTVNDAPAHLPLRSSHPSFLDPSDAPSLRRYIDVLHANKVCNLTAQSHVTVSFEIPNYTANRPSPLATTDHKSIAGSPSSGPSRRRISLLRSSFAGSHSSRRSPRCQPSTDVAPEQSSPPLLPLAAADLIIAHPLDYPTAAPSTFWTNNNLSLKHSFTYMDGSMVRPNILCSDSPWIATPSLQASSPTPTSPSPPTGRLNKRPCIQSLQPTSLPWKPSPVRATPSTAVLSLLPAAVPSTAPTAEALSPSVPPATASPPSDRRTPPESLTCRPEVPAGRPTVRS